MLTASRHAAVEKGITINNVPIGVESRRVDTGEMVVTVIGEIDLASSPVVSKEMERHSGRVVVDLRKVDFMDSTGLRVLLAEKERLERGGGHLRLLVVRDQQVARLLDVSGLTEVFDTSEALHPAEGESDSPTTSDIT